MEVARKLAQLTVEEYLRAEAASSLKHEFVDGSIFAMTGSNRRHNIISGNIFAILHAFLGGTPCRPYMEGMKVRVEAANCFYYPDVMVACDRNEDESDYMQKPVLIIEVLSASTAAVDRREKLSNYMKIPSLREYLIVHQRRKKVELYRKDSDGVWSTLEFGSKESMVLESLPKGELNISINSIYLDVLGKDGALEVQEEQDQYFLTKEEANALDW